jgi:hypothetical protein
MMHLVDDENDDAVIYLELFKDSMATSGVV